MKKIILSIGVLAILLTACTKKDEPAPKTTKDYLTAHSWETSGGIADKPVNYDSDPNTPKSADIWSQTKDCAKDDLYTFNSDGTGTYVDAGKTCSNNAVSQINWSLNTNNTELVVKFIVFNQVFATITYTVKKIDDTSLMVTSNNKDGDGLDYIGTFSFKK